MKNAQRSSVRKSVIVLVTIVIVAVIVMVYRFSPRQARHDSQDVLSQMLNAHIVDPVGNAQGMISLSNGHYETSIGFGKGDYVVATATETIDMLISPSTYAQGDLNGDGLPDAAAIVSENTGGNGQYQYLVAFTNKNGQLAYAAFKDLGDRTVIDKVSVENGEISVDVTAHGPNDSMAQPTLRQTKRYELSGSSLIEAGPEEISVISPKSGDVGNIGNFWRIQWIAPNIQKVDVMLESYEQNGDPSGSQFIARAISNAGEYGWVPALSLSTDHKYRIRVQESDASDNAGESSGFFTLEPNPHY